MTIFESVPPPYAQGGNMTKDDILLAMKEVGAAQYDLMPKTYEGVVDVFERFAALVAAAEREACAKVCESLFDADDDTCDEAEKCAAAIRARGKQ